MSTKTINYNLIKPDLNETADISVINGNMDIIDAKINEVDANGKSNADKISVLNGTGDIVEKANKAELTTLKTTVDEDLADYSTDIGIANAYKITLNPAPITYEIGKMYKFKAITANTGASTFQIGDLGIMSIKKNVSIDLVSGDIVVGHVVVVAYDGTNFQLINSAQMLDKSGGTMTGILKAKSNTSYTVAQVHNMILSTEDANVESMNNGELWVKYV